MKLDELLNMELFERLSTLPVVVGSTVRVWVTRVPGGWIIDNVFVPEPMKFIALDGVQEQISVTPIDYTKPFTLEEINGDPRLLKLQHHYDSTVGLWATDKGRDFLSLLPHNLRKDMFIITGDSIQPESKVK